MNGVLPFRHNISVIERLIFLMAGLGWLAAGLSPGQCEGGPPGPPAGNGDGAAAWQLAKAAAIVVGPIFRNDELRYAMMPPVGQAVILFGKTCLVKSPD